MTIRINLFKLLIASCFVFVSLVVFASSPTHSVKPEQVNTWGWVSSHWAIIAFVVSEAAGFLPQKFSGIIRSFVSAFSGVIKKKPA